MTNPTEQGAQKARCEFIKLRGYWKGYGCCNDAALELDGKHYCAVHYGMAVQNRSTEARPIEAEKI